MNRLINMFASTAFSDTTLLSHYQSDGNEAAFSALVERYQDLVLGTAYRRTGDADLAREVTQQVFAALARKACFLRNRPSLAGWLHQATVHEANRAIQGAHARGSRLLAVPDEGSSAPQAVPGMLERWAELEEAIDDLPTVDREVLVLRYFQDKSHSEIATALGVAEPEIRRAVARAVERLGTELRDRGIVGDVSALLVGAVAVQSLLSPPAGLAQAALAAALAGGGSGTFLTLTALMGETAFKTTVLSLLAVAVPTWWLLSSPPEESSEPPVRPLAAMQAVPMAEAKSVSLSAPPVPGPDAEGRGSSETLPIQIAGAPPRRSNTGSTQPALLALPRATTTPIPRKVPRSESRLVATVASPSSLTPEVLGTPIAELELQPPRAAEVYTSVVQQVLGLVPLEADQLQIVLHHFFDDLNLAGLAGVSSSLDLPIEITLARANLRKELSSTLRKTAGLEIVPDVLDPLLSEPDLRPATKTIVELLEPLEPLIASTLSGAGAGSPPLKLPTTGTRTNSSLPVNLSLSPVLRQETKLFR